MGQVLSIGPPFLARLYYSLPPYISEPHDTIEPFFFFFNTPKFVPPLAKFLIQHCLGRVEAVGCHPKLTGKARPNSRVKQICVLPIRTPLLGIGETVGYHRAHKVSKLPLLPCRIELGTHLQRYQQEFRIPSSTPPLITPSPLPHTNKP